MESLFGIIGSCVSVLFGGLFLAVTVVAVAVVSEEGAAVV